MKLVLALLILMTSLSAEIKILAIAGSTRKDSFNQKLINQAAEIARQKGAEVTVINLKDYPIPFYDGDLEAESGMPANAKALRAKMIESDGVILSTPEYNGAISGVLKNLIDWLSRAEEGGFELDAFKDRNFALMSASVGKRGGQGALDNLTQIIEHLDGKVMPTRVALADAHTAFSAEGALKNGAQKKQLEKEIQELIRFSGKK